MAAATTGGRKKRVSVSAPAEAPEQLGVREDRCDTNEDVCDVVIVGGGLAGCLMATYMSGQAGKRTRVYEIRNDPRIEEAQKGRLRSINLALSMRGMTALQKIAPGAAEEILRDCVPMRSRAIHSRSVDRKNGDKCCVSLQPYGKTGQALLSVSRSKLNKVLLAAAEKAGVDIRFGQRCIGMDTSTGCIEFESNNDGSLAKATGKLIIGADGASSKVRNTMMTRKGFSYSQEFISHGYKELSIPAGPNGDYQMEREALHIWPRNDYMLIALPNENGSFTLTLFMAFDGEENSFASIVTNDDILSFFRKEFPDALLLMPDILQEWHNNPVSSLVTIRCSPWVCDDKVCLIGDAAHAIVPFYGQGCNCAFEDVRIFSEIDKHADNNREALKLFSNMRKKDTDTIADLALENYVEMRQKTNSLLFVARRNLEQFLELLLPSSWQCGDIHSLVSFTNIPYSVVVQKVGKQNQIIDACLTAGAVTIVGAGAILMARMWASRR